MCDALLTRRQLIRYSALVAATYPAAKILEPGWALASDGLGSHARGAVAIPMSLDLVTVSDTQAAMTWFTGDPSNPDEFGRPRPVAASGRVFIGTDPDPKTWMVAGDHGPTPYHYVELTGLEPGTTYYWRAESNGMTATASFTGEGDFGNGAAPPQFTTLVRPPGRFIGQVAWLNDMHFGEQTSGLALSIGGFPRGGLPPGFPVDPEHPYWRIMGNAAVAEAKGRGCKLMLVNGDVSSEAEPESIKEIRGTLDNFGALGHGRDRILRTGDPHSYFVTRGNHDRAHAGAKYEKASPVKGRPDLHDTFYDAFRSGYAASSTHFSVAIGDDKASYRFVGLDSSDLDGKPSFKAGELDYMEAELARGDCTIPMFHHPVTGDDGLSSVPGAQGVRLRAMIAKSNVAGVYSGHTHANSLQTKPDTGNVPYFQGGAVKEYPGGYAVVRLYEGGYMVNYWKVKDPEARAWSERSRGEYFELYTRLQFGELGERNWVHLVDARVTSRAKAHMGGGPTAFSRPSGPWPSTHAQAHAHGHAHSH